MDPPAEWKVAISAVIFKKGDLQLPKNYRPVSVIALMSKLLSTVVYNRLRDSIELQLPDEQYGFRRGRGCDDAVHVLMEVESQMINEWGEELWVAALDVEKAFDRATHDE